MKNIFKLLLFIASVNQCYAMDLIDDKRFQDEARKAEMDAKGNPSLMFTVASKYADARDYKKASDILGGLIILYSINEQTAFAVQSVYLGKQKRYNEANQFADKAIGLAPTDIYPKLVKASWLWESGKEKEGMELFKSIPIPSSGDPLERTYYGCKTCFYASVGDVNEIKSSINKCIELKDDDILNFVKRDVVFDRYREEKWFIEIAGKTIKE